MCYTAWPRKCVLLDGAQKSIQGFSPSALSLYHTGTSLSTAVWALFSVCFLGEAKELYDTRINYSCSKASTEGCVEVALRAYYIIPITPKSMGENEMAQTWQKAVSRSPPQTDYLNCVKNAEILSLSDPIIFTL